MFKDSKHSINNCFDRNGTAGVVNYKFVWDNGHRQIFQEALHSSNVIDKLNTLTNAVSNSASSHDIDYCIVKLNEILDGVASPFLSVKLEIT